jgi:hypothetical protein
MIGKKKKVDVRCTPPVSSLYTSPFGSVSSDREVLDDGGMLAGRPLLLIG